MAMRRSPNQTTLLILIVTLLLAASPGCSSIATFVATPNATSTASVTPTLTQTATSTAIPTTMPTSTPTPVPFPESQIAFVSDRGDYNWALYLMNPDGSGVTRLVDDVIAEPHQGLSYFSWSPDGRQIAFASRLEGNSEIYVITADGSGLTRLTNSGADDSQPAWSPDGRWIAFVSAAGSDGGGDIYVIGSDGKGLRQLTNQLGDLQPTWSPDGQLIAYVSRQRPDLEIYVMNSDGSDQEMLIPHPTGWDAFPAWSPDGQLFAFSGASPTDNLTYELYVVSAEAGSKPIPITDHKVPGQLFQPVWAPDGRQILYSARHDGKWDIFVVNADGSDRRQLTNHPYRNGAFVDGNRNPAWSPDGTRIAFQSNHDGNWEIYVMNADGSGQTNLTNNPANDDFPIWQP
jgi:TolB protein